VALDAVQELLVVLLAIVCLRALLYLAVAILSS
jgi:hypothetical protein